MLTHVGAQTGAEGAVPPGPSRPLGLFTRYRNKKYLLGNK